MNPVLIIFLSFFVLFSGILTLAFLRKKNFSETGVQIKAKVIECKKWINSSGVMGYKINLSYSYFGLYYLGNVRITEYNVNTYLPELLRDSSITDSDKNNNKSYGEAEIFNEKEYFANTFKKNYVMIPIAVDPKNPHRIAVNYSRLKSEK